MDGISMLVGIGLGGVVGGVIGFFMANLAARARAAGSDALDAELAATKVERDSLRGQCQSALSDAAAAKALHGSAQQTAEDLRAQVASERAKAEQESALRAKTQQELRANEERITASEKALAETRRTIDESKIALTEAFKATGADVLKATAESLIKQAKEQFEGHSKLSQQDLESRQKAIDLTLTPLKEQLVKQEVLMKSLGERREGDAKMLGEQLKQIADLQVSASNAAQLLTSAMRDNRQRGQWGEVALRTVVEMAGLTAGVHFTEQQSVEGEEGRLRPDMIVRLPGVRCIAIDSKVPLNAYLESINPTITDAARKDFRVAHANALRTHVRALSAKEYAKAIDGDVEFTLLFIPIESAFTAAFETDPSIHPEAMQKKVLVVTPSTLLALLRTVAMHWSNAKLAENAEAIGKEAKKLAYCIGLFVEHINSVSGKLTGVNKSFNEAVGSFERRLVPSAKRLANLVAAEEVELDDTIVATPRVITFDQSEDASA